MRGTGSTRTATRWWWCSGGSGIGGRGSRSSLLLGALALLALGGCVTQTSTYFLPTPGQPRLTSDDARDQLDAVLRAECPRLLGASKPSGAANVGVDLDRSGDVVRARITQSSSDDQMDKVIGAVAARMHFAAPPAADVKNDTVAGRLRMGYSCSKDAAVATVEIL